MYFLDAQAKSAEGICKVTNGRFNSECTQEADHPIQASGCVTMCIFRWGGFKNKKKGEIFFKSKKQIGKKTWEKEHGKMIVDYLIL